jgi:hypothetical protein
MTNLGFIVATNDEEVLQKNFLSSKVISEKKYPVTLQRGYRNIGQAYNDGMAKTDSDILVCLHQDVFLPDSWEDQMLASLTKLETSNWGVLGVAGAKLLGRRKVVVGHLLDRGAEYGSPDNLPERVDTLDELLLVIRNNKELRFDEQIPTAHFYGADICLQASSKGLACFVIRAYCHHNSIGSDPNTPEFQMAVEYMQSKWRRRLPFVTTCKRVESKSMEYLKRMASRLGVQPLAQAIASRLGR